MASVPPFGRRPTLVERLRRRCMAVLCGYWRVSRWLYGALFGALVSWFVESAISSGSQSLPELLSSPPARAIAGIPLPITAGVLLAVGASLLIAGRTVRDRTYFELLDATADGYRTARRQYGGGLAQLREDGPARVEQSGSAASPDDRLMVVDNELYTERSTAFAVYADFVRQRDRRILLIVGRGGSGKSTFLLRRMGELTGELRSGDTYFRPHPCVFVNCKFDHINDASRLTEIIEHKLRGRELSAVLDKGVRGRHERALMVFVDALNENVAPEGDDINVHLTNFAREYLSGQHEIYLCLTVRETFWDEQRRRRASNPNSPHFGWLEYVYLPDSGSAGAESAAPAQRVSVPLKDFDDRAEFDEAYRRHRQVYEITGEITDHRTRQICRNPLLLRIFCMAFRGQDIRDLAVARDLVRDLDIFDAYARQALSRIADQIGLGGVDLVRKGETLAHRAIRGLLLELALGTVDRGRQFLSSDEVFAIAQGRAPEALSIRGQRIDTVDGLLQRDSPLRGILDEGIVLESSLGSLPGYGQISGIRFVFERYLEYCIGRGLVRAWRLAGLTREEILDQFRGLMARHVELRAQSFDNLPQGLAMAVLVAEQAEPNLPPLPPGIHLDLLDVLVRDADFSWNQLACRVIQQLRTFNRPRDADAGARYPDVEPLLAFLDELAKKNDFVLRWDVERALLSAVEAGEGGAVLRHLQTWLDPTAAFAQRLFAAESVGFLFTQRADYQASGLAVLRQAVDSAPDLGFWIIRSITFSISTMMIAARDRAGPARSDGEADRELRRLSATLLRLGRTWWDRSVVLAGQIEYDCAHGSMAPWLAWPWASESGWTRVNAALAVEHAGRRGDATVESIELLRLLRQSSPGYDPHLSWAIWQVLGHVIADLPYPAAVRGAAAALRAELAGEARQRLDDPRAGWITDHERPGDGTAGDQVADYEAADHATADRRGMPDAFPTPVALVYHPEYGHTDLHNHPESKERVQAILDALEGARATDGSDGPTLWTYLSPNRFRDWNAEEFIRRAHLPEWIHRVQELSRQLAAAEKPNVVLETDLEVRAGSYEGAALAVRGAVCAVDLVTHVASVRLAVALVRPPGHLAGNKICIFNNVAIAARHAQQVLGGPGQATPRVLIVDVDAHHGKSTQDIFYGDASVLYFSTHQAGVHPGTGQFHERGAGDGAGYTVNVPIPPGSGDEVYATVLRRVLDTVLAGFRPELILVSLGLDAYHADSFSQLDLTERSYCDLAAALRRHQQDNPSVKVAAAFEGGYDLPSMGRCVLGFMSAFGDSPAEADPVSRTRLSPLDNYLVQGDQESRGRLSAADRQWLTELDRLQDELEQQWRHTTSRP